MHVVVALVLLVPIALELLASSSVSIASALAWLPLRRARRRVAKTRLGGAYRQAPTGTFELVPLPESLLTPKGERVRIDAKTRRAWLRHRSPAMTFVRMQVEDTDEGFEISGAALPVPLLGLVLGSMLMSVAAVEVAGPSVFVVPAVVFAAALIGAVSAFVRESRHVDEVADALVAHVVAEQESAEIAERGLRVALAEEERGTATAESPSAETRETPSTPPPTTPTRRSSS
jgi:hypothetical protein